MIVTRSGSPATCVSENDADRAVGRKRPGVERDPLRDELQLASVAPDLDVVVADVAVAVPVAEPPDHEGGVTVHHAALVLAEHPDVGDDVASLRPGVLAVRV